MFSLHIRFASDARNVRRSYMRLRGVSIGGSFHFYFLVDLPPDPLRARLALALSRTMRPDLVWL